MVIGWSCGWISGPVLVASATSLAAAVAAACCASLLGFIFLFLGWSSTGGADVLALDTEEVVAEMFSKFSVLLSFWFFPAASVFLSDFSMAVLHFETVPVFADSDEIVLLVSDPTVSGVGEWCLCCGEELFERSIVVLAGNGDEVE